MKAPSAAPMMVVISNGSACSTTWMFPPWAMNTPKTHPSASSQPMMTNMSVLGYEPLPGLIGPAGNGLECAGCAFLAVVVTEVDLPPIKKRVRAGPVLKAHECARRRQQE